MPTGCNGSPRTRSSGSASCSTASPTPSTTADALTALIYGVPKLARGLALDDPPTDEVKADQKAFFRLLYNLLVAADRGPRLPTLFARARRGPGAGAADAAGVSRAAASDL